MRNLTLGVLIVCGGTLAALPFRKSPDPITASADDIAIQLSSGIASPVDPTSAINPRIAITPNRSNIIRQDGKYASDAANIDTDKTDDSKEKQFGQFDIAHEVETSLQQSEIFTTANSAFSYSWNQPPSGQSERLARRPLTYDDLAVPLAQPAMIDQRFAATTNVRQRKSMHSGVMTDQIARMHQSEIKIDPQTNASQRVASIKESPKHRNAALASSTKRDGGSGPTSESTLPQAAHLEQQRERLWIRQPD